MKIERSASFSYHVLQDKDKKVLHILEMLTKKGVISRTEVSKAINVNIVSISNYVKSFIDKKLVLETGLDESTGGRKPELIELNARDNYVMGVDIAEEVRISLADISMDVKTRIMVPRPESDKDLAPAIAAACAEVTKKSGISSGDVKAVGVGISNHDHENLPGEITARLEIEVFLGDRISCAAFGERRLNVAADSGNILYVASSVGRGIIIKDGACIEEGAEDSEDAVRTKYLRPWPDSLGVAQIARESITRGMGTAIVDMAKGEIEKVTDETVIEAADHKDEIASGIIQNVGANLGIRVAYLINLFDPEVVVIGGGIEKAGEMILGPMRRTVMRYALNKKAKAVKIVPAGLGEDAASLGAAWLAVREIFLRA